MKNLYILSSRHFIKKLPKRTIPLFKEVLRVRMGLLEVLVRDSNNPGYFYDGGHPEIIDVDIREHEEYIEILRETSHTQFSANQKRQEVFRTLSHALGDRESKDGIINFDDLELYETENRFALFLQLALEGHKIEYKVTEHPDYREMSVHKRDATICQNIDQLGNEENILFIGQNHPLSQLQKKRIKPYRVEIRHTQLEFPRGCPIIHIYGELPRKFEDSFNHFLWGDSVYLNGLLINSSMDFCD